MHGRNRSCKITVFNCCSMMGAEYRITQHLPRRYPSVLPSFPLTISGKPRWFMELNPKGEVPVLVVDGKPIVGSEETVDYLMQGELGPEALRWRAIVNDRLKPAGKRAVFSGGSEADRASLTAVLQDLEACLPDGSEGIGESFSAADASAFPFLQRVHGEFGFPSECRRLEAWYASARSRPGVRKTIKEDFWWWW